MLNARLGTGQGYDHVKRFEALTQTLTPTRPLTRAMTT